MAQERHRPIRRASRGSTPARMRATQPPLRRALTDVSEGWRPKGAPMTLQDRRKVLVRSRAVTWWGLFWT